MFRHLWYLKLYVYFRIAGPNNLIPKTEVDLPECKHLDHCAALKPHPEGGAGWLTFALPDDMSVGRIFVCCVGGKDCVKQTFLDTQTEFVFDNKLLDSSKFTNFPNEKCLQIQEKFTGPLDNKFGHLFLSVRMNKPVNGGISHVVAF